MQTRTERTARIRDRLGVYLREETPLRAFAAEFQQENRDYYAWEDDVARRLAARIQLWLAEYSQGEWSEDDLRAELLPLMVGDPDEVVMAPPIVVGDAVTSPVAHRLAQQSRRTPNPAPLTVEAA
jgi:hypothetical protein